MNAVWNRDFALKREGLMDSKETSEENKDLVFFMFQPTKFCLEKVSNSAIKKIILLLDIYLSCIQNVKCVFSVCDYKNIWIVNFA